MTAILTELLGKGCCHLLATEAGNLCIATFVGKGIISAVALCVIQGLPWPDYGPPDFTGLRRSGILVAIFHTCLPFLCTCGLLYWSI